MNFYFDAAGVLDKVEERQSSIKALLSSLPAQNRKRTTALVLEALKCVANIRLFLTATRSLSVRLSQTSLRSRT